MMENGNTTDCTIIKRFAILPEQMTSGVIVYGIWYEIMYTTNWSITRPAILKLSRHEYLAETLKGTFI